MTLRCVRCAAPNLVRGAEGWRCAACRAAYPIVDGVARFVDREQYAGSFGFQWNRFSRTQLDSANASSESRDAFVQKTTWPLADLAGRRVLDAGCGMGRFAEVVAEAGAEVHAADLSTAVDAARRNLGHRRNVSFYQADILNLPFQPGTFDYVYSLGVLHHTPDTRRAFMSLVPLVKPGGRIAIWVYSSKLRLLLGSEMLRLVTPRLPKPVLLQASKIAIPLYYVHRIPLLGLLTQVILPTSPEPNAQWRWLDTFDWYSPRYQFKHSFKEVEGWFRDAGLEHVQRAGAATAVAGRMPAR